ncbi:hypothetical protein [Brevundimonas sp. NPDC058933]|uniref:hypothetical protein n=1 Tax=Brevundimonas sp. NPDC058933 TaxID=3346673 RepID=UPI003BEED886
MTLQGKLLVAAILAIILIATGVLTINKIRSDAYQAGQQSERQVHADALAKVNEANAKTTQKLEADLADAGRRYDDLAARRRDREQVIVREVEQALPAQPNCEITPEILALRNRIRNQ